MHNNATKCNETLSKWCKNKHGASKIMDTLETYQCAAHLSIGLEEVAGPVSWKLGRSGVYSHQLDLSENKQPNLDWLPTKNMIQPKNFNFRSEKCP
jgi:hypothetical protein